MYQRERVARATKATYKKIIEKSFENLLTKLFLCGIIYAVEENKIKLQQKLSRLL